MPNHRSTIKGFGINDWPGKIAKGSDVWHLYQKWRWMIGRVHDADSYQDCHICDEWRSFKSFYDWASKQDWKGNELDKDVKFKGNKLYSPDACLFLPRKINLLFRRTRNKAGASTALPAGVYAYPYDGAKTKYKVNGTCPETGKAIHLGYCRDPRIGHLDWQANKVFNLQSALELDMPPAARQRIEWEINRIKADISQNKITEWY